MDLVAILDTETTGLEVDTDSMIELAVVRYSLRHRCVIDARSSLVIADGNAAEAVNRIPAAVVASERYALPNVSAVSEAQDFVEGSEAILAHNADFDRQWLPPFFGDAPWIDTCNGVDWPSQTKPGENLITLALEHGLGVVDPHRALSDCLLLARLLARCAELGHDVEAILARGLRPTAVFQALVSFQEKDLAKDAGFKWDPPLKRWIRKMAIEDAAELPFRTIQVQA